MLEARFPSDKRRVERYFKKVARSKKGPAGGGAGGGGAGGGDA